MPPRLDAWRHRRPPRGVRRATVLGGALTSFPYVAFAENIGLVRIFRVTSRFVVVAAGVLMVLLGLVPKAGALMASVPHPELFAPAGALRCPVPVLMDLKPRSLRDHRPARRFSAERLALRIGTDVHDHARAAYPAPGVRPLQRALHGPPRRPWLLDLRSRSARGGARSATPTGRSPPAVGGRAGGRRRRRARRRPGGREEPSASCGDDGARQGHTLPMAHWWSWRPRRL
uniref:solute carrier family 23 protein n=1 Tax=Streptomyces litmocidini TaxID=67318 RepID=UPI00167EA21E